jgi:predicted DCC family thiol-disulfide oxidoreductase YuxK
MRAVSRKAYSDRGDSGVPHFDDRGPIVFMDGDYALCSGASMLIAKLDRKREFHICAIQSRLGSAVFRHYGLDPGCPDSWLYLIDGKAYISLDAVTRVGARLRGWGQLLHAFTILPGPAQDWLYRRIARNRYSIFGRKDMCAIADPALVERLLL